MKLFNRIFAVVILIVIFFWAVIWLASPFVTRMVLGDVLASHNVVLDDSSSVRLNIFSSKLSIKNLMWVRDEEQSFKLDKLQVRYSLFRLALKQVHIYGVTLSGLTAQATINDDNIIVVGFDVPVTTEENPTPEPTSSPLATENTALDLVVNVPEVILEDMTFHISHLGNAHRIDIERLLIENTTFKNDVLDTKVHLKAKINGALTELNLTANYTPSDAKAILSLALSDFNPEAYRYLYPEGIQSLSAKIDVDFNAEVSLVGNDIDVAAKQFNIGVDDLAYVDSMMKAGFSRFVLMMQDINIQLPNDAEPNITLNLSSELSNVIVNDAMDNGVILDLTALSLDKTSLRVQGESIDLHVPKLALNKIILSERHLASNEELPPMLSVASFEINDIQFMDNALTIKTIDIGEMLANIIRDTDGEISTLVAFPAQPTTGSSDVDNAESESIGEDVESQSESTPAVKPESSFAIRLDEIKIIDKATIVFSDKSLVPAFDKIMHIDEFSLNGIDSKDIEKKATFNIRLTDEEYFKHTLTGDIQPFKELLNFQIESKSTEFTLHEVSPYIEDALGFQIQAGQFDSTFNGVVVDSILDGKTVVKIRGAKFSSGKKEDEGEKGVIGQAAIPLNVALNMLKDGDGNINLTIPIDGDVNDPNFGVQYILGLVVKKAVMGQAKKHLINTFVPYGQVLSVAMAAGSFALKVRFEDLPYAPAQIEPSVEQSAFIEQFTKLMQDKKEIQVRVCPIATPEDIGVIVTQTLTDEQKIQLSELARQRASAFKKHVVEKGVESSRLLICSPKVENKETSIPSLNLSV